MEAVDEGAHCDAAEDGGDVDGDDCERGREGGGAKVLLGVGGEVDGGEKVAEGFENVAGLEDGEGAEGEE